MRVPPPHTQQQGEVIDSESEHSEGAQPSAPTHNAVTPMPTLGGGVGEIITPDVSSTGTLGSTPLDPPPFSIAYQGDALVFGGGGEAARGVG